MSAFDERTYGDDAGMSPYDPKHAFYRHSQRAMITDAAAPTI